MDKQFDKNQVLGLMHENSAFALYKIADHIEKWKMTWEETVQFLRETADLHESQSMLCEVKEQLNTPT